MNTGTFVSMELLKILGGNIKARREALNLSQSALARLMKIDPSQVSRVEKGTLQIGLPMVERYAQVLKVDFHELFLSKIEASDLDEQIRKAATKLSDEDKELLLLLIEALLKRIKGV